MTSTKKKIFLLTSILSVIGVFISATPVMAYDIITAVTPTGKAWEWGSGTGWLQTMSANGETDLTSTGDAIFWGRGFNNSFLGGTWVLKSIVSGNNIEFIEGNYYKTQISFNIAGYRAGTPPTSVGVQVPIVNRLVLPSNSPYKLVSITPAEVQCYEAANYSYGSNATILDATTGCYRGNVVYDIIVQATRTATGKLQLGDGASWFFQSYVGINYPSGYGTLRPLTITEYKPDNASVINEEQQQAGQQAQQEGNTGSDASQESVTQGSQTMLQGAQTILGVITDTPAGTCNISGNMGNIDLGQLNFCEGNFDQLRPVIRIIVNLVMGVATWHIFTFLLGTMTALFLSFTGGRKVDGE